MDVKLEPWHGEHVHLWQFETEYFAPTDTVDDYIICLICELVVYAEEIESLEDLDI